MYCTPAIPTPPPLGGVSAGTLSSLQRALTTMPDPRSRYGQRYDLPFLLTCLVAALLCGCNSTRAVGQWCQEHQRELSQVFGPAAI